MVSTVQGLIILVLFVLPGFLLSEVARRGRAPAAEESALRLLLRSLVFALFTQALAALVWTVDLADKTKNFTDISNDVPEVAAYVVVVLMGVPVLLGLLLAGYLARAEAHAIATRAGLSLVALTLGAKEPTHAWDIALLEAGSGAFLIVTLKNERTIAGQFGGRSFATEAASENADLFLERVWLISETGEPIAPLATEEGIWGGTWIPRSEIISFAVYKPRVEEADAE